VVGFDPYGAEIREGAVPRVIVLLCLLIAVPVRADPIAVTVGDSIVRTYPEPHPLNVPIQGWGAKLPLFTSGVTWVNRAVGGTSTKTFIENGHWATALAENADYILIQFGYGDSSGPPEHTEPETTYRGYLHQMIVEARAIGTEPILVTPAGLRHVALDGVHVTRPNGLEPYADAMIAQAAEDGVYVIDMQTWSLDAYDEVGFPDAQEMYGFLHPDGWEDRLHFGITGAIYAAAFVAEKLPVMIETSAPGVSVFPYETR
jgi:lysophospholipase L1-like esterase